MMEEKNKPASAPGDEPSKEGIEGKEVKEGKEVEEAEEEKETSSSVPQSGTTEDKKEEKETEETASPAEPARPAESREAGRSGEPEPKPKKRFSFSFGKKKVEGKEEKKKPKKQSQLGSMLASINNIGMGRQAHLFIQSTATMLKAGLPLIDTLRVFQMEVRSKGVKKVIGRMIEDIENGATFWHAMENQHLFSPYDIAMVRIGEEAGNLARNMEYLAEQREKDRSLKQKVKMAMIYPSIVVTMMFIIVMGLGLFVLPNLVGVLFALDVDLPLTTRVVIWVTNAFSTHGKVFVPLILITLVLFVLLAKFTRFRAVSQWMVFHTPGIGRLARQATIARFGVILGGLLRAGVPFVKALESLVEVTQVVSYKKFYADLLEHIKVGDSLSTSFSEIKETKKLLPVSVQQLIVAGERSGSLSESLLQISTIYEKKASETAEVLPVILEPILLLIIGALVGAIAFAIIVPIYSVVGNIGNA